MQRLPSLGILKKKKPLPWLKNTLAEFQKVEKKFQKFIQKNQNKKDKERFYLKGLDSKELLGLPTKRHQQHTKTPQTFWYCLRFFLLEKIADFIKTLPTKGLPQAFLFGTLYLEILDFLQFMQTSPQERITKR